MEQESFWKPLRYHRGWRSRVLFDEEKGDDQVGPSGKCLLDELRRLYVTNTGVQKSTTFFNITVKDGRAQHFIDSFFYTNKLPNYN